MHRCEHSPGISWHSSTSIHALSSGFCFLKPYSMWTTIKRKWCFNLNHTNKMNSNGCQHTFFTIAIIWADCVNTNSIHRTHLALIIFAFVDILAPSLCIQFLSSWARASIATRFIATNLIRSTIGRSRFAFIDIWVIFQLEADKWEFWFKKHANNLIRFDRIYVKVYIHFKLEKKSIM